MKVPFLNLTAQYKLIKDEIAIGLQEVMDTNAFAGGPMVERFENVFAPFCGTEYAIGVGSGTDALWMALLGLGIGAGDEVIVPVNTFIATAEAVSFTGAAPVFVDCDEYYNVEIGKLREVLRRMADRADRAEDEKIRRLEGEQGLEAKKVRRLEGEQERRLGGERIRAIIPVHLYGQPANMDEIMAIADEYELAVIEDACQAHGAEYKGRRAGSIGDAGCFSFYPGKNLGAYGEAGAIVTNNSELAAKLRMFRDHGQRKKYYHSIIGWNARMDGFQGAVLSVKMKYIDEWTKKRQENARLYNELLAGVKGIQAPKEMPNTSCVYHLYVIQSDGRDGLKEFLEQNGIGTGIHYPIPLHLQEAYKDLGYKEGDFPVAEKVAKRILSLPMFPELTEAQIGYVCEKIEEYMTKGNN
ncbi:MAG: DegT/DnrJ/EryC1/StrS family aminotransferase [Euryarchaeota archaeon]|nr:DegT/DnrJ/EryC1/StrS family aminotransferase [Euryarchaeota archaeon]